MERSRATHRASPVCVLDGATNQLQLSQAVANQGEMQKNLPE
jgi:hypothetical protein